MKSLVLDKPGSFSWKEITPPQPEDLQEGEALLKVRRIGVCGTDLHAFDGSQPFFSYPRILGHELGVEVLALGTGTSGINVGDICAIEPYRNPSQDHAVRRGKTNCGENLQVLGVHEDGGMQEYIRYPASLLHSSDTLSLDQLALVEPMGIGCHAVNRAQIQPDDTVLVIGVGPIGLGTVQFAKAAGAAQVLAMDINPERLAYLEEQVGIDGSILASSTAEADIRSQLGGDLPTVVFDVTGNAGSMMKAFEYVAFGGKLVYIGLFIGDIHFHDPYFHKKELTLLASRNANSRDFQQVLSYISEGKVKTDPWITHRARFEEVPGLFPTWKDPKSQVMKAMIEV
ncbi:MAG: zinc-binding alcohol dehydrogenase family protein [Bacteroidota bacterium]